MHRHWLFASLRPAGGGGPSVPVITGAPSPAIGDILGNDTITIPVVDSTGCTGATVNGVALTSFAIVDATHVRGVTGAHAANATADVVVTNATGPSTTGAGLFEYYDPTAIWDFYADGTVYAVTAGNGTWTSRKGANATNATTAPDLGSGARQLGGRNTVDFSGSQTLDGANLSNYATSTGWASFVLFNADTIGTDNANPYDNDGLWCDVTNDFAGMHLLGTPDPPTLQVYGFQGGSKFDNAVVALSTWEAGFGKFDGAKMYSRLGSGAWSAGTACTTLGGTLATALRIGSNYNGAAKFDGRMAILAIAKVTPSDPALAKFITYVNARWGTTF